MRFVHLSDTHLGYRQYGLYERELDFYNVFDDIVEKIIDLGPDFVIHSGDLFEFYRPPTHALLNVQKNLSLLRANNIPVYSIPGNHDIIQRRGAYPPQILFKDLGLNVISNKNPFFVYEDVFIGGSPYISKHFSSFLSEKLKDIEKLSRDYDKRILVLHQGIDKYLPYEFELELADIPESFNYYAMGHLHSRIIDDYGLGKLAYPGSTEVWKLNEVKNYTSKGKGFYFVDLDSDIPNIDSVNIDLPREFISENIVYSEWDSNIKRLVDYIKGLNSKPLLNLSVSGGNFNRSDVFEELNGVFSSLCLSIRPTFNSVDLDISEESLSSQDISPEKLLTESLSDFDDDVVDLGIHLFDNLSKNKIEESEVLAKKFYDEYYDN